MMWLSLGFESVLAMLMIAMIVYAVKLNRRLVGLRERDAEMQDIITRFVEASDRAEASVARLKAAGLEAERSLRLTIERAEVLRGELATTVQGAQEVDRFDDPARPAPGAHTLAASDPAPPDRTAKAGPAGDEDSGPPRAVLDFLSRHEAPAGGEAASGNSERSDAEQDILRAIRSARGEG